MKQPIDRQWWIYRLALVMLILGGLCPVSAQVLPDEVLFEQGRTALQQGDGEKGIAILEGLRTQYPQSGVLPDVDALLFDHYLAAGKNQRATGIWDEACRRWPQTEIIMKMVKSNFTYLVALDPASAFKWLDTIKSKTILPPGSDLQLSRLRLDYLEKTHSNQFFTEAMALINSAHAAPTIDNVRFSVELADKLYFPLMQEKRFAEARYLFQTIMAMTPYLDNTGTARLDITKRYLTNLEKNDYQQFSTETLAMFSSLTTITALNEIAGYRDLARQAYKSFLQQGHFTEAQQVHQLLLSTLVRLNALAEVQSDEQDWLAALYTAHNAHFVPEVQTYFAQLDARSINTASTSVLRLIKQVYGVLYEENRPDDAQTMHTQIQAAFGTISERSLIFAEYRIFADAHIRYYQQNKPDQFAAEALPIFTALLQAVSTGDELKPSLSQIETAYRQLAASGHFDEAKVLHDKAQATILRVGNPFTWLLDDQRKFMEVWWKTAPKSFESTYIPQLLIARNTKSRDDLDTLLAAVRYLYPKMVADGRLDDVKSVHEQLQALCATLGGRSDQADDEYQLYLASLAMGAHHRFISEVPAFIAKVAPTPDATIGSINKSARLAGLSYTFLVQGGGA